MARQFHGLGFLLLSVVSVCPGTAAPVAHFIGPEACALCHRAIAAQQKQTAMAATWQGCLTTWLPPAFQASAADDLPSEKAIHEYLEYNSEHPKPFVWTADGELILGRFKDFVNVS